MLSPDVTMILDDPQVGGGQPFDVIRTTRTHTIRNGDTQEQQIFHATGNIQPSGTVDLQQMQPQDKCSITLVVRTTFHLELGHQTRGGQVDPDIVVYQGNRYRVLRVDDWCAWSFVTAYITQIREV